METKLVQIEEQLPAGQLSQPLWQRIILLIVLGYEAAGGLTGGILLITAPDGRYMNMPVEIMHGAFPDFLIPGILLLGLGIVNTLAFLSVLKRLSIDWFMASLAMGGFIIWFVVEIIILNELHWLHIMWGIPVLLGAMVTIPLIALRNATPGMYAGLLICGILSSAWYIAINIFVPMFYEGYSLSYHTPSELSAIGAPTRLLWVLIVLPYQLLFAAFAFGVLLQAGGNRLLRISGGLILIYCILNLYWPPMHMRGQETTLSDTLHLVWAAITVVLMLAIMVTGAFAFGKVFRLYTIFSIILHTGFGILTFREAPNVPINEPTPTIGIWERINIAIFLLWVIVFAILLLRKQDTAKTRAEH